MTAFCVIKKIAEDLFGEIFCCLKISNVRVKFHVKYTYFLFFELFFMNSTEFADVVVSFCASYVTVAYRSCLRILNYIE